MLAVLHGYGPAAAWFDVSSMWPERDGTDWWRVWPLLAAAAGEPMPVHTLLLHGGAGLQ